MKIRLFSAMILALALSAACAQDAPAGQGQRGGMGGVFRGGAGSGLLGTVTEVAADHYTMKTDAGQTYIVHYSANTRIFKQLAQQRGRGQGGQDRSMGAGGAPEPLKPTDIKVGDAITAIGEVDATARSVGAVFILQVDPERAKMMREMQANYGKTWLMGKVTAVDGVKVSLMGSVDNAAHSFLADENTTFRKRREPITLGDIAVGDMVRVEGAVKDGAFVASTVTAMGVPAEGTPRVPREDQPR